jgi:hypothetical protein
VATPEPIHLVARFFDVATAKRLRPGEQQEVAGWLIDATERDMFWDQPAADQRHGLGAARYVARRQPERIDLIRAALLHDTGKRFARLGIVARSWASLLRLAGKSGRGRVAAYLDHGPLAAAELEAAGAEALVVDFARSHHGERPASISVDDWALLDEADRVRR